MFSPMLVGFVTLHIVFYTQLWVALQQALFVLINSCFHVILVKAAVLTAVLQRYIYTGWGGGQGVLE